MPDERQAESQALIDKKLEIVSRILELKAESRKVDLEMLRIGGRDLNALAVMECW